MVDLFLLVADKNAQFALRGALRRPKAFGVRKLDFECAVHSQRDGGVRKTGPDILRLTQRAASHAILMLDYEGSGAMCSATALEDALDERLAADWGTRAKAIVVEPELDVWMWGSDNVLETLLQWNQAAGLRPWLLERGFEFAENGKPTRKSVCHAAEQV